MKRGESGEKAARGRGGGEHVSEVGEWDEEERRRGKRRRKWVTFRRRSSSQLTKRRKRIRRRSMRRVLHAAGHSSVVHS